MTDLGPILNRLGLGRYLERFLDEGFETWETVVDITESDLDALGVKLGHRRRLQREIANARGVDIAEVTAAAASSTSHHALSFDADDRADPSPADGGPRTKRKYKRHPKADSHAPDRAQSAYVVFSNKVREDRRSENLSFTEMAKRVGEMWQAFTPEEREPFEAQAGSAKEEYLAEMAHYRLSSNYKVYSEYLVDFKAKHPCSTETKKPKLESHASTANSASMESPVNSIEFQHRDTPPPPDPSPSSVLLDNRQQSRRRVSGLTSPHLVASSFASSRGSPTPSVTSVTSSSRSGLSITQPQNPVPRQAPYTLNPLTHAAATNLNPLPPIASIGRRDSSSANGSRMWFANQPGSASLASPSPLSNYRRSYHPPPAFVQTKAKSSSKSRSPPSSDPLEPRVPSTAPRDGSQGYRLLPSSSRASGGSPMDGVEPPGSLNNPLEMRGQSLYSQGSALATDPLPPQQPTRTRPSPGSSTQSSSLSSISLHAGSSNSHSPHSNFDPSTRHASTPHHPYPTHEVLPNRRRESGSNGMLSSGVDPLAVLAYAGDIVDRHSRKTR